MVASTDLQRSAAEVTDRFLAWLRQNEAGPFFGFVHFYDIHMPRAAGYDGEVSLVDQSLGEIDRFLRENRLLEKTDIVLTSDHGESLGEHGEAGHGFFVYDSTLHVPLIIRPAGSAGKRGRRIEQQVSLIDVMPTILDSLHFPIPSSVQGKSLRPLLFNGSVPAVSLYSECFIPELHFGWSPLRSLRFGRYKYIDAPRPELYDVVEDRGEVRNLYSERPDIGAAYRKKLARFIQTFGAGARPATAEQQADPDTVRKLLSLGYLNTGSGKPKGSAKLLVDPKDRIAVFDRYHAILNELSNGRLEPSVLQDLGKLQEAAPEVRGIAYLEAWAYELGGNLGAARERYQVAVKEQPENTMARARYATVLIKLREVGEAEQQLKEVLRRVPADYRSRNNLAGLYAMTGRREQALHELTEITRMRPDYAAAWQNLGRMQTEAGNWKEAEAAFLQAAQIDPRNPGARLGLAYALRAQGRLEEAAREEAQAYLLNPQLREQTHPLNQGKPLR